MWDESETHVVTSTKRDQSEDQVGPNLIKLKTYIKLMYFKILFMYLIN